VEVVKEVKPTPKLWCKCGKQIKQGTMIAHWTKEHRDVDLNNKEQ
jgi:hypothetical protein